MGEYVLFTLRYGSTKLYFGVNVLSELEECISCHREVVVVTGKTSAKVSGALRDVEKILKTSVNYVIYDNISPNPWASQVEELAEVIWSVGADLVIAIGGGSPIDAAKMASVIALSGGKVKDYVQGHKVPKRSIPLLAINLTHGTGTEVDRYAVVTLDDTREKHGLSVKYPEISIDDPRYTLTLDKKQTIYTSLDAFYHSYESATCKSRNLFVESLAREAISIITNSLPRLVNDLKNLELREKLLYASMIAGIAIDSSSTHVIHAIEHVLSGLQPKLPHGCGLALIGPRSIYYTHKVVPEYSAYILRALDPTLKPIAEDAEKAQKIVEKFQREVGFDERLSDYGFTVKDIDLILDYVFNKLNYLHEDSFFPLTSEIVKDIVTYSI